MERTRRKGSRELQGLACSINYEKGSHHQEAGPRFSKNGRRSKGVDNEDSILKCQRIGLQG